jgi:hypothetical protein
MRRTRLASFLVGVALWGLFLVAKPSHVGAEVDGLAYTLHWPTVHSCQSRGQDPPIRHCLVLSLLIGSGAYRGEEASWCVVIYWRVCPLRYLSYGILHTVNGFY